MALFGVDELKYLPRSEELGLFAALNRKEALAIVGPRRAGKSTLAIRLLQLWRERGGAGDYFDLEKVGASKSATDLLAAAEHVPKGGLLVFDEVQALTESPDDWVRLVRQEVEYSNRHVIVTGSSASLLSSEIASALAGRAIPETVLTLSYADARAWGVRSFDQYLAVGGYPECVLQPDDAQKLHQVYLQLGVLRDVAARLRVRNTKPLRDLAVLALSEAGKTLSAQKTAKQLGISAPTLRSYLQGLVDAFLVLPVPPFEHSPRRRLIADAKNYAFDVGLQKSVSVSESDDRGRRLENLVAIELYRRGYRLSYLRGERECDFIAEKFGVPPLAVQVCDAEGAVPEREVLGLEAGMKAARANGLLLTRGDCYAKLPTGAKTMGIEEWLLRRGEDA